MSSWGIALWTAALLAAGPTENTRCQSAAAWLCDAAGCRPTAAAAMEWTISPGAREMRRCDAAGCRNLVYDQWIFSDGQNRYVARGGLEILTVNKDGSFIHVAPTRAAATISAGRCAPTGAT